ncbi:Calx-beta domain-containing protein [Bacteroidota bacterium]
MLLLLRITACAPEQTTLPAVGIFVWDEKGKEGSDGTEIRLIQVGEPVENLEVKFKIDGTAKEGHDFRPFSKLVKMGKSKEIRILPVQDGIIEGNETASFTLLENKNYRIEPAHASATITIEDGELPDVQFVHPSSGNFESQEKVNLKILLSESFEKEVEVKYTVRGVLAEPGNDYRLSKGLITIKPGNKEAGILLNIMNDEIPEDDETIRIRLTDATNANIGRTESHYYTIKNDDGEVKRSILYDRIYGALTGFRAGCSMGAITEPGFSQEHIAEIFGLLDTFKPFVHYGDTWSHPAGATEDGGERHKLMCTAIIEKQDRNNADDLLKMQ